MIARPNEVKILSRIAEQAISFIYAPYNTHGSIAHNSISLFLATDKWLADWPITFLHPDPIRIAIPFDHKSAHLYPRGDEKLHEFFPQTSIYPLSPVVISGGIENKRKGRIGLAATLPEDFLS